MLRFMLLMPLEGKADAVSIFMVHKAHELAHPVKGVLCFNHALIALLGYVDEVRLQPTFGLSCLNSFSWF